jgi:hypothetical protein
MFCVSQFDWLFHWGTNRFGVWLLGIPEPQTILL